MFTKATYISLATTRFQPKLPMEDDGLCAKLWEKIKSFFIRGDYKKAYELLQTLTNTSHSDEKRLAAFIELSNLVTEPFHKEFQIELLTKNKRKSDITLTLAHQKFILCPTDHPVRADKDLVNYKGLIAETKVNTSKDFIEIFSNPNTKLMKSFRNIYLSDVNNHADYLKDVYKVDKPRSDPFGKIILTFEDDNGNIQECVVNQNELEFSNDQKEAVRFLANEKKIQLHTKLEVYVKSIFSQSMGGMISQVLLEDGSNRKKNHKKDIINLTPYQGNPIVYQNSIHITPSFEINARVRHLFYRDNKLSKALIKDSIPIPDDGANSESNDKYFFKASAIELNLHIPNVKNDDNSSFTSTIRQKHFCKIRCDQNYENQSHYPEGYFEETENSFQDIIHTIHAREGNDETGTHPDITFGDIAIIFIRDQAEIIKNRQTNTQYITDIFEVNDQFRSFVDQHVFGDTLCNRFIFTGPPSKNDDR